MSHDGSWPPLSPHAALVSSPSGRRKYEAYQTQRSTTTTTSPNLLDRLRAARKDNEGSLQVDDTNDDMAEDEETLQLQLAAIQAKLKLKRLQQQNKTGRSNSALDSKSGTTRLLSDPLQPTLHPSNVVEVPKSPTRRIRPTLPKSPSRVLLGIDKGLRATDVSLRRAKSTTSATGRSTSRSSSAAAVGGSKVESSRIKPFGERMAEAREHERSSEQRREMVNKSRSRGFGLDETELNTYRSLARESPAAAAGSSRQTSPARSRTAVGYSRDQVLHAGEEAKTQPRSLGKSMMPLVLNSSSRPSSRENEVQGSDDFQESRAEAAAANGLFEGYSQLHLSTRILPHSFLNRTLPPDRFTVFRVPDLLKVVTSPNFELPETVCDYVVCGVIASKSSPMDQKKQNKADAAVGTDDWRQKWEDGSQNQRRFMALTLTDLRWTVDLYLFGTALPRYHRLTPGTVVAILNPGVMPPKAGRADTGAFSLSLNDGDDTVLEIGTARDLGYCRTLKKDGKECGSWLDASKTEICEWHLNAQLTKTRSQRMGVNTGTNGFGTKSGRGGGRGGGGGSAFYEKTGGKTGGRTGLLPRDGHRYDRSTGSHFYIASSNPTATATAARKAAPYSTFAGDDDDPFLPEGHLSSRDRDSRVRKHLAAQQKEREIAEKLGSAGHGLGGHGFGSAGAEYLRQRARTELEKDPGQQSSDLDLASLGSQRSANILAGNTTVPANARKRTAADVRLSPVKKKTRFVTDKGIREAGRESLGVTTAQKTTHSSEDDDDELEIV